MKTYGLLGYPLSHSFSQGYFTDKFSKEGVAAVYENFSLPDIALFPDLINSLPQLAGMNVTIPYKQAVMPYLDALDPEAQAIGAINVIRVERSGNARPRLVGFNSDLVGFRESIRPYIEKIRQERSAVSGLVVKAPLKALILGTGGASKAIAYGLRQLGVETLFVSRTPEAGRITYADLNKTHYQDYPVIVNTTPLGMSPNIDTCPPLDYTSLGPDHLLFDAVYNPEKTVFLRKGEEQGATIKNGLEMLHLQAEAAWKIWSRTEEHLTDDIPLRDVIR
jgi:shikimate dehydrogenase